MVKCFRVVVALLQVLFEVLLVEFSCCRGLVFRAQTKKSTSSTDKKMPTSAQSAEYDRSSSV